MVTSACHRSLTFSNKCNIDLIYYYFTFNYDINCSLTKFDIPNFILFSIVVRIYINKTFRVYILKYIFNLIYLVCFVLFPAHQSIVNYSYIGTGVLINEDVLIVKKITSSCSAHKQAQCT